MTGSVTELWRDFARPRFSVKGALRATARHAMLSARAVVQQDSSGPFIRCVNAHYVFDDQRLKFERAIRTLKGLGQFVTTEEAVSLVRGDVPLDGRYFHLSFDDGLHCLLRNAAPILVQEDVPAIAFVNSALAGQPSTAVDASWRKATNYRRRIAYMSWDDLREIRRSKFEIGSHTRTHRRLTAISRNENELRSEIAGSKADIERELGESCRYFAWPFGASSDIDEASLAAVRDAGFEASFGSYRQGIEPGRTDPFQIPRHHLEMHWPLSHIRYFARGGMESRN